MSILKDTNGEWAAQTTTTYSGVPITICGFFKFDNFTNFSAPYTWRVTANGDQFSLSVAATSGNFTVNCRIGSNNNTPTVLALSSGVWYFLAGTRDSAGTTHRGYARAVNGAGALSTASGTPASTSLSYDREELPNQGVVVGIHCAGLRTWTVELTSEELERESRQLLPVKLANLISAKPCIGKDLTECYKNISATGTAFTTQAGTPSVTENPPIPWRAFKRRRQVPYAIAAAGGVNSPVLVGPRYGLAGRRGLAA